MLKPLRIWLHKPRKRFPKLWCQKPRWVFSVWKKKTSDPSTIVATASKWPWQAKVDRIPLSLKNSDLVVVKPFEGARSLTFGSCSRSTHARYHANMRWCTTDFISQFQPYGYLELKCKNSDRACNSLVKLFAAITAMPCKFGVSWKEWIRRTVTKKNLRSSPKDFIPNAERSRQRGSYYTNRVFE